MAKRHSDQLGNLESLFLRLEELVLANSGEDEFEEVFKLVVAKLWDERGGKPPRFRPWDTDAETFARVAGLLHEADKGWPGVLAGTAPALTPEHLAVCVGVLARHRISDHTLEVLDSFFEFMVSKAAKGAKGQFFTPRYVAELCVRLLRPTAAETVLDPACGSGGFLIHALNHVRRGGALRTDAEVRAYCASRLWGFDLDARAVRIGKALMVLAGDGSANLIRLNSLLRPEAVGLFAAAETGDPSALTVEDVCRSRLRRHRGFDVILTNPPFAGEVRERHLLDCYAFGKGRPRVERDLLFLERCVQLLRPGGRMAVVLPHNKYAAGAFAGERKWLFGTTRVLGVVGLGRNTFLPHTHQKASVLLAQKLDAESAARDDYEIFFAVSERDGKDSRGRTVLRPNGTGADVWDRVDHDFDDIVSGFRRFCDAAGVAFGDG
ncbi:MAG: N-6 DNA methylase [Gemmataceae bacterium]|nr:N-6 DNA methylase [Gemmataceae bacterium]